MVTHKTFVFLFPLVLFNVDAISVEGYYWKDYNGVTPPYALPGGTDAKGHPIFMGQILHDGRLSPAKIYLNDDKAYYGYNGKENSGTKDIKILCSQYLDRFRWIPVKNNEIHLLTNRHIVKGGSHPGKTMYFGRVPFRGEFSVGKVSTESPPTGNNKGLYITQNGKEFNFREFEILVYDEINNSSTLDKVSEIR